VHREYLDEELQRLATDPGCEPQGWTEPEIEDFRLLVQCARAAEVDTDLRNMRMLRLQSHDTGDPDRALATLSSGRVIDLTFKNAESRGAVLFALAATAVDSRR
jgi:hypothetical protein